MSPYCNYCNTRCFKPTTKDSLIKTDLEATCLEGIIHGMNSTYPKLKDQSEKPIGWLVELRRGEEYSLAAELVNGEIMPYEVPNTSLEEILDFTKGLKENTYYRTK